MIEDIFLRWEKELLNGHNMENLKANVDTQDIVYKQYSCATIYCLICEIRAYKAGLRETGNDER